MSYVYFIMFADLQQFVLGQENGGAEAIIQLLIFGAFIAAAVIKSIFAAKQEQTRKQNQKKPVHRPITQKAPATAEKIRMQRERYEQFLENILQPKKPPHQSQPPKPTVPRPQPTGIAPVPVSQRKTPPVYTNQEITSEAYREMSQSVRQAETDTILDKNAIKLNTQLEQIAQLKEEHIQEDQQHLIYHNIPGKQKTRASKSPELIFAFSDSDDLKKAILYTEILGKPLSLRESEALYD